LLPVFEKNYYENERGNKVYELTSHLGNVHTVVADRKIPIQAGSSGIVDYYTADVVSVSDFYPFGSVQPGRSYNSTEYRYGYNTQEKVDEISGSGNHYTAPYWEYDPRTGRRWNLDPAGYPYQSHYSVNNNNPILFTDPLGIYGTKREARQMRREAKAAGLDPSKIYKSGDDYGFNTIEDGGIVGNFKRNYFGSEGADVQSASNLGSDPLFENPFKRISGTFTAENQITTFLLGTSDNKKYFEPSSGFSYMMKNSPGVKDALDNYLNKGKTETGYGFSPNIKSMKKFWESLPTSIEAHLDVLTNGNLARLSVGGYTAIVTPTSDENIIRIHLVNDMSMGSILLHSKWAYDNPPKTGPLSTVEMKIDLGLFDIGSLRKK
jgi:RHS repeat-associated protein